jgi:hypothetical protein
MYGCDRSCGVSKKRLGKTNINGNQRSAHRLQIVKMAFPPRILPKKEAMITNGNKISMIMTKRKKA